MTKRQYFNLCLSMPREWLSLACADPSAWMTATHLRLGLLALRTMDRRGL